MAPTPIPAPSPTGITGYSAANQNAGGGQAFVASGPCSGTALVHTQDLVIGYELVTYPKSSGTWFPSTVDTSALKLQVWGIAEDALQFFSTSSVSGAQCATAADARQAQRMVLSSTTTSTGMGTAGSIYTLSAGYERRWSQTGDVAEMQHRSYQNMLFPIEGYSGNRNYDQTLSNNIARLIVAQVISGGLQYSSDGIAPPDVSTEWNVMDFSLIDI